MKKKALARQDRLRQIMLCFAIELQEGRTGEMTCADIARKMGLSVSTKLRLMIEELVIDSLLISTKEPIPGIAKFRRVYRPNHGQFKRPTPQYKGNKRQIKINSKQMSIFAEAQ